MSKTIDVWWIRRGSFPCVADEYSVRPVGGYYRVPSVWFDKQEALNDPYIPTYMKRQLQLGLPDIQWELVCTPIEFTEEELNEALHHRR